MKILLTCCVGMSSSLLAEMMGQEIIKAGKNDTVICIDQEKSINYEGDVDVILLAPQVKHMLKRYNKAFNNKVPIGVIPDKYYGTLDGKNTLKYAYKVYNEFYKNINVEE